MGNDREEIATRVRAIVARLIERRPSDLDAAEARHEVSVDSLTFLEALETLRSEYAPALDLASVRAYLRHWPVDTVDDLVERLEQIVATAVEPHEPAGHRLTAGAVPPPPPGMGADVGTAIVRASESAGAERVVRFRHLRVTIRRRTALLLIDRPPANLLDLEDFDDFERAAEMLDGADPGCVVVTGSGSAFCAGLDLGDVAEDERRSAASPQSYARGAATRCLAGVRALTRASRPLVAAVNGLCAGAGLSLALACHVRLASERARFVVPETGYGLLPGAAGTQLLAGTLGSGRTLELLLTCEVLAAETARRWGLCSGVLPHAELLPTALRYAERVAQLPGVPLRTWLASFDESAPSTSGAKHDG